MISEALLFSLFIVNGKGEVTAFHEKFGNVECFVVPPPFLSPFF